MNNENLSEIIEYLEKMHKYVLISRLDMNTFKEYVDSLVTLYEKKILNDYVILKYANILSSAEVLLGSEKIFVESAERLEELINQIKYTKESIHRYGLSMNNKEYSLHMVKIAIKACKTLEHMQSYVLEYRISQTSFIEYSSLLKILYNEHFIDDEDILSYANSLLNARVIIKQEDIYNQTIEGLSELVLSIKGNLER